ncbi:hypothetical protein JMJ77_0005063, partial [Colletotrichum scovillei]
MVGNRPKWGPDESYASSDGARLVAKNIAYEF